jgi:integrase
VPITHELGQALWATRRGRRDDDLVFTSEKGRLVDQSNLMSRVLKPAAAEAGLGEWKSQPRRAESWVGFHAFRHTCATMLFRQGLNAKQVQLWLGHHSPSFTLDTYVHLLPDDLRTHRSGRGGRGNRQVRTFGRMPPSRPFPTPKRLSDRRGRLALNSEDDILVA